MARWVLNRGWARVLGLPRSRLLFKPGLGIRARLPKVRRRWRRTMASSPLYGTMTFRQCQGRPRVPARTWTASSNGTTWARTAGPGQPYGLGEAVEEKAFPFSATGDPLTAAFARGQMRHQRPRIAMESSHVPRQVRGPGLASRPNCHWPASAAATGGRHFWTPIGGRAGDRPSGSR
jgi:hypothetical protein